MGKPDESYFNYLDDNRRFADQMNGALFQGKQVVKPEELEFGTDEFFSGMTGDEKFTPVITLVVYCGTDHAWDGARCLYDLLDIDDETKAFVTNYKLNLYDCHEHDTFDEYRTGLRQLFETVRYGKDKEQFKKVMEENKEAYNNIDSDTREVLEVIAKVKIPEGYKVVKNGEKRFEMCKAMEDLRLEGKMEGKMEGRQEHLIQAVCKKLQKNKSIDVIADELEEKIGEVERVVEAQKKVGNYDAEQICKVLMEQK